MRIYYLTNEFGEDCITSCPFEHKEEGVKVGSYFCQYKCKHCLGHSSQYTRYGIFPNGEKMEMRPTDWVFCTAPYNKEKSKIRLWYLKYIYLPILAFIESKL
jgi:hypothetical protein